MIELLVVIAIIGLLASVILASTQSARVKAAYARANADMAQFIQAASIAQNESGKRLQDITGSSQSMGPCVNPPYDVRNVPTSDPCYAAWQGDLTEIQAATNGSVSGIDKMTRDPWGSPYGLDENEREFGPTDCRYDSLTSAGPDGIFFTSDDIVDTIGWSKPCP